jgi:inosose dehydratase
MKATGYSGTELGDWGFMPTEPEALKRELNCRTIYVGSLHPSRLKDASSHKKAKKTH